jgi:GNAT superfamily N-acetyltransferase
MRLKEFAPSPERDDNDDIPDQLVVLANRWWNATDKQPQIEHVLNSLGWSIHQVESEDDAVQLQHRDGTTYFISADDFDPDLFESQEFSTEDMIAYLRQHHDTNLHQDYLNHIKTFNKFVLKNIPVSTIKTELSGLDRAKVEQYKKMDFSKAPPIVMGDGYILDGYHRATVAKALGIPTIRAYVGVKGVNEISDELRRNYLNRAGKVVDRRMDHMARVRDRLNKGYEIYHADRPAGSSQIVDRFEADTPALARQYYEKFIQRYESDVDFDLRLRRATGIMEIARIPQGDFGDKDTLRAPMYDIEKKPLPGGSGFTYAVGKTGTGDIEIMIFDSDTLAAELDLFETQDVTGAWRVNTVAVNPEYRGRGLGKALYGIALSILKLTLEAGDTQTRHGQRMWLMLNSIPGVEVMGYNMERTPDYQSRPGDNIIAQDDTWTRYTFPVKPGVNSMRSARRGTGMYTSMASMIAKWTGK